MNNVRLVSITKPVIEDCETAEQLISFCARVSNPSNQTNFDTSEKLLKYCAKNSHWSVFEMADMTVEIETTRDIGRQILRHRSFNFQEFSQRYAVVQQFTTRECRLQDKSNRQNSISFTWENDEEYELSEWFDEIQNSITEFASEKYKQAIEKGIAKEQARVILPEGLTMSRLYMKGNIRSWIHYCSLRCGNGTQKEHREIAEKCKQILLEQFPSLIEILE